MKFRELWIAVLLASAPSFAADSVFVDGAFNGSWGASFPFIGPTIIGPINFKQISDADGIAGMDRLHGAGTAAQMCPPDTEKREFYGGDYDYQKVGEFFGCTDGTMLRGVYRDYNGLDFGTILIDETFPNMNPPR